MRSQISFEFIILFTLLFVILSGFLFVVNQKLTEIHEQQQQLIMSNLAMNIKSEVRLASSVSNNYVRKFNIPARLDGREYKILIENDELIIELFEGDKKVNEYYTTFPVHVKGTFLETLNENTTEHCVSKSDYDGIRISRNLISLEPTKEKYHRSDMVEVIVRLSCVTDLRSARFTLRYDPNYLICTNCLNIITNPYEIPVFEQPLFFENQGTTQSGIALKVDSGAFRRRTWELYSSSAADGSGNLAKLIFQVNPIAPYGNTTISFDPELGSQNVVLLDIFTSSETSGALVDSKKDASLEIIP